MEIRDWHIKDIYFNEGERQQAERLVANHEKCGWWKESNDIGNSEYDNCIQLKRDGKHRQV